MDKGLEQLPAPETDLKERLQVEALTVPHEDHPDRNDDAMLQLPQEGIFAVFDGLGGYAGGDVASRIARANIASRLQAVPENANPEEIKQAIEEAFAEANRMVVEQAKARPELSGMGTTASVVFIRKGKAVIGNVGDSRVYVERADGTLEQITLDDNILSKNIKTPEDERRIREIQNKFSNVVDPNKELNNIELYQFNARNIITQFIGTEGKINPRIYTINIQQGDKLLLTSDGIHDNLTDQEIKTILDTFPDNKSRVKQLVDASRRRSRENTGRSKKDDMSAMVVEVGKEATQPETSTPTGAEKGHRLLKKGSKVKVRRSSGTVEGGWQIVGFNKDTGYAIVQKKIDGQTLQKEIPQDELTNLNPPEKRITIGEAENFQELFLALDNTGIIQGSDSQQTFDPATLKKLINRVRSGNLPITAITRTDGLRQKVADLMQMEQARKSIKQT